MRKMLLGAAMLTLPLAACKKTGDDTYQVKTPTVGLDTHTVTTPSVDVGTKKDTINTPVIGTKPDTVIIQKPVVGTKKTEVTVPTVKVTKVPFDKIRSHLPASVRTVSPEERRNQIRIRQEHVQRRYRQY